MSASVKDRSCPYCGNLKDDKHSVIETSSYRDKETGQILRYITTHPCVIKYQDQYNLESTKHEQHQNRKKSRRRRNRKNPGEEDEEE